MAGPKKNPTFWVPKRWNKNIPDKIAITIGIVGISGMITSNPSTAEATEIGGVMIPSANKVAAPKIVGIINLPFPNRFTRAYNEKTPPSPWLSAFKVKIMY